MKDICIGGSDKITIIDVNQKSIIRGIEDKMSIYALCKLNDNILLSRNYMNITQWKITQNNLELIFKN